MLKDKFKSLGRKKTKDKPVDLEEEIPDTMVEEPIEKPKKQSLKERLKAGRNKQKKKKQKIVKKNRVAIDIGTKNIKIVEALYDGKSVTIKNLNTVPTPPDCYNDGQIQDINSLRNAINSAIISGDIESKEVIYTIESKSIITRDIELPSVVDKDIKNMLDFEIGEYFPVNLEEYVVQSKIVDQIDTEQEKKSIVAVSILPKKIAEEYIALTESLGLKPVALDKNDNSIYKLLNDSFINNDDSEYTNSTVAIVDIGFTSTNIIIIENGIFRFSRIVDSAGRDIDMNIANSYNLSLEESEQRKLNLKNITQMEMPIQNLGVPEIEVAATSLEASENMIKEVVAGALTDICKNIEIVFRYYTSRGSQNTIDYIYIYGATSKMEGIDRYIENTFNTRTFKINRLTNVRLGRKQRDADISLYANAIGAIIRK